MVHRPGQIYTHDKPTKIHAQPAPAMHHPHNRRTHRFDHARRQCQTVDLRPTSRHLGHAQHTRMHKRNARPPHTAQTRNKLGIGMRGDCETTPSDRRKLQPDRFRVGGLGPAGPGGSSSTRASRAPVAEPGCFFHRTAFFNKIFCKKGSPKTCSFETNQKPEERRPMDATVSFSIKCINDCLLTEGTETDMQKCHNMTVIGANYRVVH